MRKFWRYGLIGLAVALILLVGAGYVARTTVAEWLVERALAARGFPAASLEVAEVSANHAEIHNLSLAPDGPTVAQLDVDYAFAELLRGRIRSATLKGAAADIDLGAPAEGEPVSFRLDPGPLLQAGLAITVSESTLTLRNTGLGDYRLDIDATADLTHAAAPVTLRVAVRDLADGTSRDFFTWSGEGTLSAESIVIDGPLQIDIAAWNAGGWAVDALTYSGLVRLRTTPQSIALELTETTSFTATLPGADDSGLAVSATTAPLTIEAAWADGLTGSLFTESVTYQVSQSDRIIRGQTAAADVQIRRDKSGTLELRAVDFAVVPADAPEDTAAGISGRAGIVTADAQWTNDLSGTALVRQGAVTLPGSSIELADLEADLPFSAGGIAGMATATAHMSHSAETPLFHPLTLSLTAQSEDGDLVIAGNGGPAAGTVRLGFAGRYQPASGAAAFTLGPETLTFAPGGLQPSEFSPALDAITSAKGNIRIQSTVTLSPGQSPATTARVTFDGLDAELPSGPVKGLRGTIAFLDLLAPRTAPGQALTAQEITLGVPLAAPQGKFQIQRAGSDPLIVIESAQGEIAGGRILLDRTPVRLKAETKAFEVLVDHLSLEQIFDQWTANRLSGAGRVSGAIPLTLGPNGIVITNGRLAAEGPGTLQVHWGESRQSLVDQGQHVALMVEALEDFHYDLLQVDVNRPSHGALGFNVRLEGNNPAVLDGQPFRFNIGLAGNLETVLAALSQGTNLTLDLLRSRLEND